MSDLVSLDSSDYLKRTLVSSPVDTSICEFNITKLVAKGPIRLEHFACPNVFNYFNQVGGMNLLYSINGGPQTTLSLTGQFAPTFAAMVAYLTTYFLGAAPLFTVAASTVRPGTIIFSNGYAGDSYFYLTPNMSNSSVNTWRVLGLSPLTVTIPAGLSVNTGYSALSPTSLKLRIDHFLYPHHETGVNYSFEVPIDVNDAGYIFYNSNAGFTNFATNSNQQNTFGSIRVTVTDGEGQFYNMNSVIYKLIFSVGK